MSNWTHFDEAAYYPATPAAAIWQASLAVLAALMLDTGETGRAWSAALLSHWAIIWLILLRRPLRPTRFDLAVVRYAMLPLLIIVTFLGCTVL